VPFNLDIPDTERAYLGGLPLSQEAKERTNRFVEQSIANVSDEFRLNPENRPLSGPYFLVQFLLLDIWGDGLLHTIDFHIRDDHVAFGVLLMVFIDHH
jgi:hypothetical protein